MIEQGDVHSRRPASLFHYTDAGGLLGILRKSCIWASDLRFLNDAQEAVYALEQFRHSINIMENPALEVNHPAHEYAEDFGTFFGRYRDMIAASMGGSDYPVYVACFCESGDLLSQWRAYGSEHGYAIEFKTESLDAAVKEIPGYPFARLLMPVRYGMEAAATVLSTALQEVSNDTNLGHYGVHAHYMALRLSTLLAIVKHPGFSEEREWRTIAGFERYERDLTRFRDSSMSIVPYIEIPFPREAVVSIRVGPGRHVDIRQEGVRRLLDSLGYEVDVLSS